MKRTLSLILAFSLVLSVFAFSGAVAESSKTLVVIPYAATENMDPYSATSTMDKVVARNVFDSLWRYDAEGAPAASLAESWETSEDGHTITAHLRKDVTFSDGTPFNADAVIFSYDTSCASNMGYTTKSVIASVTKVDDYTVELEKATAYASLENYCVEYLPIVSPTAYADIESFQTNPVGTGAYVVSRFDATTNYVYLTARDDYFLGTPAIKNVEVRVPLDSAVALVALETGEVQLCAPVIGNDDLSIAESEGFIVERGTGWGSNTVMTLGEPYTSDQNLRLAICHAINRENAAIYNGETVIEPATDYYAKKLMGSYTGTVSLLEYDPELAKTYLAQSNYAGETLEINATPDMVNIATSIQADLQSVGITATVNNCDSNTWAQKLYDGTVGITLANMGVAYASPEEMMGYFATDGFYFSYGLTTSNEAQDENLKKAGETWNADERATYTIAALEAARDLAYVYPLYEATMSYAHSADLQGCEPVWAGTYNYYLWQCSFAE